MIEMLADCYFYNVMNLFVGRLLFLQCHEFISITPKSHIYHTSFLANRLVSELVIKETAYSNERVYNCSASNFFKDKRRTDFDFVDVTVGKFSNTRKYFVCSEFFVTYDRFLFAATTYYDYLTIFAKNHSKARFKPAPLLFIKDLTAYECLFE